MATQDKGKDTQGRKFEQGTHSGTGSAASVGPGGTGGLDKLSRQSGEPHAGAGGVMESQARGPTAPHGQYGGARAGGADTQASSPGIAPSNREGGLQTGTGGSGSLGGSGNRQSGEEARQADSMQSTPDLEGEGEQPGGEARDSGRGKNR